MQGRRAGGRGEEMGERVVTAKFSGERSGLWALPIKQRILVHHRGEAGQLGRAPTARAGKRFVDDGHRDFVGREKEKVNALAETSEAKESRGVGGADQGERFSGEASKAEFVDLSPSVEKRRVGPEQEAACGDFLGEQGEGV